MNFGQLSSTVHTRTVDHELWTAAVHSLWALDVHVFVVWWCVRYV